MHDGFGIPASDVGSGKDFTAIFLMSLILPGSGKAAVGEVAWNILEGDIFVYRHEFQDFPLRGDPGIVYISDQTLIIFFA